MDTFEFQPKLKRSWLVQRLQQPAGMNNPFSFGGGLVNGGIPDNIMRILDSCVCSFDYMGSAEFEWGIVPSCLKFLGNSKADLRTGVVDIYGEEKPVIYYICHKDHEPGITERLVLLATNPPDTKERVYLQSHFKDDPYSKYSKENVGWLDCSNGFMFFVDHVMYGKFCNLFNITPVPQKYGPAKS